MNDINWDKFMRSIWLRYPYAWYIPKEDRIVATTVVQKWVDEGNKIMIERHDRERAIRYTKFMRDAVFLGEIYE